METNTYHWRIPSCGQVWFHKIWSTDPLWISIYSERKPLHHCWFLLPNKHWIKNRWVCDTVHCQWQCLDTSFWILSTSPPIMGVCNLPTDTHWLPWLFWMVHLDFLFLRFPKITIRFYFNSLMFGELISRTLLFPCRRLWGYRDLIHLHFSFQCNVRIYLCSV